MTRDEVSEWRSMKAMLRVRIKAPWSPRSFSSVVVMPVLFFVMAIEMSRIGGKGGSSGNTYALAVYAPMAFSLGLVALLMHLLLDKTMKRKHVGLAQGLSPTAYWVGTAMAQYTLQVPVVLLLLCLLVIQRPYQIAVQSLPLVFMVTIAQPISQLAFGYNVVNIFKTPEIAMKSVPLVCLFAGSMPALIVWILLSSAAEGTLAHNIGVWAHIVLSFTLPLYMLPGTINYLVCVSIAKQRYGGFDTLAVLPLCAFPLLLCVYSWTLIRLDRQSHSAQPGELARSSSDRKDEDVIEEEARVRDVVTRARRDPGPGFGECFAVLYDGLHHTYRTELMGSLAAAMRRKSVVDGAMVTTGRFRETQAVRGISLGIERGECFGLLGPNGAGKTTTLAVLTSEVSRPSAGCVYIQGNDISQAVGQKRASRLLGFCPQVDPLWEFLSGYEHLMYYGRVKGVKEEELERTVSTLLERLGLARDSRKLAGRYSGGMKRKLSVGIALIGQPPILFLDEPSAAVDAGAKRHLWEVIKSRYREQTVVLTTHSMEEAEALCGRIAVQVLGQLRCLGSPMQIKNKYGSGYQLEIILGSAMPVISVGSPGMQRAASRSFTADPGRKEELEEFVRGRVSKGATIIEHHAQRFVFQLPPREAAGSPSLGMIFQAMQGQKDVLCISEYSIKQTTLEQVFLRFAKEQHDTEASMANAAAGEGPLPAAA
eukprot:NODE_1511_length_2453_cov_9.006449.p1 GENE.NODE_1511_length_2453_cov_9.006449~~NODE_1511_length_2453_cov_9.006449.p1  ORF type:complete len:765 (+),score=240.58 NODE_1511_length_2453_cov_9.006449:173-2296(+)